MSTDMGRRVGKLRARLHERGCRADDVPDEVLEAIALVIDDIERRAAERLRRVLSRLDALEAAQEFLVQRLELAEADDDDPPGEVHGRVGTMTIGDGQPIPIQGWTRDMQGIVTGFWEGHTAPESPRATSPLPPDPPDRGPFGHR